MDSMECEAVVGNVPIILVDPESEVLHVPLHKRVHGLKLGDGRFGIYITEMELAKMKMLLDVVYDTFGTEVD